MNIGMDFWWINLNLWFYIKLTGCLLRKLMEILRCLQVNFLRSRIFCTVSVVCLLCLTYEQFRCFMRNSVFARLMLMDLHKSYFYSKQNLVTAESANEVLETPISCWIHGELRNKGLSCPKMQLYWLLI